MQFSVDQITLLVYLVRDENTVLRNIDTNQLMGLDAIVYYIPMSGEVYWSNNTGFWTFIHKLTIVGQDWDYASRFKS